MLLEVIRDSEKAQAKDLAFERCFEVPEFFMSLFTFL